MSQEAPTTARTTYPDDERELTDGLARWREVVARRAAGSSEAASGRSAPVDLAIVVPCYNEVPVLPVAVERLALVRASLVSEGLASAASTIWFVDDGSHDETWALVEEAAAIFPWLHGIKLSRNRGHQNALIAGLVTVSSGAIVTVDADLQDDLGAIREMLVQHAAGAEVVYGVRRARRADTWFKRTTAEAYYRLLRGLGVDVVFNHADFRLLGERALAALRTYGETNLFLRGIVPQLGFRTARVEYERKKRVEGESKYPLRKMVSFAVDGITSFSAAPIRWIAALGLVVAVIAFLIGIWAIVVRLAGVGAVPGWASVVVPVALVGGIQLVGTGVIGEYVGKVYMETKRRPRFIIEKTL
jgi:glycosyltransferase involved in cell wall biosynthesis